ncbi:YveK family protein [Rubrobacter taiwanensis]|uniref:YveK family protein n=1 Tax=Rubrobacter taiwanensis TaxID=185139 RepID=UPI001404CC42|nr:Wzz/FepE/Etk N-terminal domain-containing protein [Rubrobacter taiwanensis]
MSNLRLNGRRLDARFDPRAVPYELPEEPYGEQPAFYQGYDPVQIIRRRFWIIVLVPLLVAGLAAAFSYTQTPVYEASIKLLIEQGPASDGAAAPSNLRDGVQGVQEFTATMAEAINTRPVAEGVVRELNLPWPPEAVQAGLSVQPVEGTQFILLSYRDSDPERAQRIANAYGEVFSEQISSELSPGIYPVVATVWERAVMPYSPISPNIPRNVLLGLAMGLMLGVGLAFLLDYLDDDWKSREEVEQVSGVAVFGAIPPFKIPRGRRKRKDG